MYPTEAMITACEDMSRSASEMERNVKDMMEMEGRAVGIELDKRKSARKLWEELHTHTAENPPESEMTWAYVPADMPDYDHAPTPHVEPVMMEAAGIEYPAPPAEATWEEMAHNEVAYHDPAMMPSPANHQDSFNT
jgi:hypothetical protein|tara:strand:+ start:1081 stop:1488 length:408 start_codon:yes stop_codon:yes gene_type:complete